MGQRCTGGAQAPADYVVSTPRDSTRPDGKVLFYSKNNTRVPTELDDSLEYEEDNVTEKVSSRKIKFDDEAVPTKKREHNSHEKASSSSDSAATLKDYMQKREQPPQAAASAGGLSCVAAPAILLGNLFTGGSFCPPPGPHPVVETVDGVPVRPSKPPSPNAKGGDPRA